MGCETTHLTNFSTVPDPLAAREGRESARKKNKMRVREGRIIGIGG